MSDENKTVVLVADDEPSTLALVSGHLRAKGYRVIEATDGDQAWELAHEHLPHLRGALERSHGESTKMRR